MEVRAALARVREARETVAVLRCPAAKLTRVLRRIEEHGRVEKTAGESGQRAC